MTWRIDEKGRLQCMPENGKDHLRFSATETYQLWALLTANHNEIKRWAAHEAQQAATGYELEEEPSHMLGIPTNVGNAE